MFIDASAIAAVIVREPDAPALSAKLIAATQIFTSPLAGYEAALRVARSLRIPVAQAQALVDQFLLVLNAEIVPITAEIGRAAIHAFERYGRRRHPAQLNMGDCFAYACARALGVPLRLQRRRFRPDRHRRRIAPSPTAFHISRRAPPGDAAEDGAGHQPGAAGVIVVIRARRRSRRPRRGRGSAVRSRPRPAASLVILSPPKVKVMPVVTA